jgi:hypothetical protein
MKVGRLPCFPEITATTFDMSAFRVPPGAYKVRLTVGGVSQTRDFRIRVDPRLDGNAADAVAEYAEIDRLSASLYQAVTEMGAGLTELHRAKDQLEVILELTAAEDVEAGGAAMNAKMDAWIAQLLQKELRTFQNHYQFEARLLMKYKDLLDEMGGNGLPLNQGYRDVTRDYLAIWERMEAELQAIRDRDIPAFNEVLRRAGLPELYVPRPIS